MVYSNLLILVKNTTCYAVSEPTRQLQYGVLEMVSKWCKL